jgi:D-inositol-3-phosphate glycosyltransferase
LKPLIGLIVPSLEQAGGVTAVARFIKDRVLYSGRYNLRLISLATSARDESSVSISRPTNWARGVITRYGQWQGLPFVHVGATVAELEFQRYRPRRILSDVVAECDILQVVCGSPALAHPVCGLGKPVSVQCATRARVERRRRDINRIGLVCWWRKVMTKVTDRMENRTLRLVDAIQVENRWMYEYARQLNEGREVDLRYAPPGVNARSFCPASERNIEHAPYILCVGRLGDPRKNIGLMLEAYALIPERIRSRVRLVLAGISGPPDGFWQRAMELGLRDRINFIHRPPSDKLVALYQQASVFALPSDEEGLGVVLLEAMACGVPVISTRSGGPDGIITNGKDGFLVALDDGAALADRMARLLLDSGLNREMGQRARATIEQRYSEEVAGQAFLEVWEQLLHKAGKT